jgi:hypothetical protein
MSLDISALEQSLAALRAEYDAIEGEPSTAALFPESFVQSFTDFESFEAFLGASPWEAESLADLEGVPVEAFDDYVDRTTGFGDWESMLTLAGREYVSRRLHGP